MSKYTCYNVISFQNAFFTCQKKMCAYVCVRTPQKKKEEKDVSRDG